MSVETRYKKFLAYIPEILSESPMDLQQIYDKIKARFPLDCNDKELCIHKEVFYQYGEWKHLVRTALEHLKREHAVLFNKADGKYQLK